MTTRRGTLRLLGGLGVAGLAGCSGEEGATTTAIEDDFAVASAAIEDGGTVPAKYTADGENVSPPLSVSELPAETETLAVIVDDPDAPGGTFVHWLLWNVPGDTTEIPEALPQRTQLEQLGGALQGTNGFGEVGYRGPAPPKGDGPHTYRFTVHAVDAELSVVAEAKRPALSSALEGATVGSARLTATYER